MYKVIVDDEGTMYCVIQDEGGAFVMAASEENPPTLFNAQEVADIIDDMNQDLEEAGEIFDFSDEPVGKFSAVFVKLEKVKFLPGGME